MRQDAKCSSTTTTTVQITKVRGLSLDILALLQSRGGLYTPEIAEEVGKSKNHVRRYMHNLLNYGCVDRFGRWGWEITPSGSNILLYNNNNIDERNVKETCKIHETSVKDESCTSCTTPNSRQLDLSLYSDDQDVSDPERVVVAALAEHYEKTGVKYRLYKDTFAFCDEMEISSFGVNELIAKLKQDGVIYMIKDYQLNMWKIGLKKDFVERLQYC